MNEIIALIPSLDPTKALLNVVSSLKKEGIQSLVINDGSSETYDEIFDQLDDETILLKHDTNKGKGRALKTGMEYIDTHFKDRIVVCVDGDGQHLSEDVLNCAKTAEKYRDHLILGVRNFEKDSIPFKSYYGNKITETIFHLFTGVHITDTQTGLRAFHQDLIKEFLSVEGERYEYEMDQLLYCVRKKIPFREVNIKTVYEGNNECSHFHALRDSFLIYKQILKFTASSILSFFLDLSLFELFSGFLGDVVFANVSARVFSGLFNYGMNRNVVFQDEEDQARTLLKYFCLAVMILIVNTVILSVLVDHLGLPKLLCKVFTELLMFLVSWYMQKNYVFVQRRT